MSNGTTTLSLQDAYANRGNAQAQWEDIREDFAGEVMPHTDGSFRLQSGDTVFTVGSCFARNIEDALAALGCRLPMLDFHLPPDEFHGRANSALNRFTPPMFFQTFEWAAKIQDEGGVVEWRHCEPMAFEVDADSYLDTDIISLIPVSRERFLARRQHIYDITVQAFTSDVVMMTPGYVEAWFDKESGLYIYGAPKIRKQIRSPLRYELHVLGYQEAYDYLDRTVALVEARNPNAKFLITTSPVPLGSTFSGQDIRIANTYSKSILRAACGALAQAKANVDYFPSYESATMSSAEQVWQPDRLHVKQGFVGKIVAALTERYFDGLDDELIAFQQAQTAMHSADYPEALKYGRQTLAKNPKHLGAALIVANVLKQERKPEEAEQLLEPFMAEYPERADVAVAYAMAIAHQKARKNDPLIGELIIKAADFPQAGVGEIARGVRHLVSRNHPRAEDIARKLCGNHPHNFRSYLPLLDLLKLQGRKEEMAEMIEKMSEMRGVTAAKLAELRAMLTDEAA